MSTPSVSLSRAEYEVLLDFAYQRRTDVVELRALQKRLDASNDIKRYLLNIRWYEVGGQPPSRIEIKENDGWPPRQEFILRQDRPIAREDVDLLLREKARNPVSTTVTRDERGVVGWTELDVWAFNLNV